MLFNTKSVKMDILEIEGVYKSFGGVHVLKGISLSMTKGETLSLIGPNGAGKTTLLNIISGFYSPDSGNVKFEGKIITRFKPHKICRLGIARTFQIPRPLKGMSVRENVITGLLYGRKQLTTKKARNEVDSILKLIGLHNKSDFLVENLTIADKKRLELAKALACDPKLILCDEIMSGLTPTETKEAVQLLKKIRKKLGISLFVIEHVMSAVMAVSDRVAVLNRGKLIFVGKPGDAAKDKEVIETYLGR